MTVAFAITISILMLLACGGLIWYAHYAAQRKADALLASTMLVIQSDLADSVPRIDPVDMQDNLRAGNMALRIVNSGGHTLYQSSGEPPVWPLRNDGKWVVKVQGFRDNRVVLGLPWRETEQTLRYQALLLLMLGLFVTVAATIADWFVVGRTLSPIGALANQARAASAENLHLRLLPPSEDAEIVGLVATLNGLLVRISETVAAKGRFHAAASHELRTPLQVLRGQLELALHRDRSNAEYRQFIVEADVYARRVVVLAQDLLLLHQLDAARSSASSEVNLVGVCERTLTWLEAEIRERGIQLQREWKRDIFVNAAPSHVEMLVRNLIENSVKYADRDGRIIVAVRYCVPHVKLHIWNSSSALPADEDVSTWLEPFVRPDSVRHPDAEGTGLGLAICKAIVDANGWTLELCREQGGVAATVNFADNRQERAKSP